MTAGVRICAGAEAEIVSAGGGKLAEREGFEPSVEGLPLLMISSHADSTTLASLRRSAAEALRRRGDPELVPRRVNPQEARSNLKHIRACPCGQTCAPERPRACVRAEIASCGPRRTPSCGARARSDSGAAEGTRRREPPHPR